MNDQVYDLFAVVLHTGTLNGGHYTSVVKNKESWYEFNDDRVFKIQKHETNKIVSNHAYILFYQKRGLDFDNITNYEAIRNSLQPDDQIGQQNVRFPILEYPLVIPTIPEEPHVEAAIE